MYKEDEDRELAAAQAAGGVASAAQGTEDTSDQHELRGLLWMTPQQMELARRFHHVLFHDNPYRCNVFGMPLGLFCSVNEHGHTIVLAQCIVMGEKTAEYEWAITAYSSREPLPKRWRLPRARSSSGLSGSWSCRTC